MSARGPILWKVQRLHRAVRKAREEAAARPVELFHDREPTAGPETGPRVLVTPPPPKEAEAEPTPAEPIEAHRSTGEESVGTDRELCPICSEYPIQTDYRGKGLCLRCVKELRGW